MVALKALLKALRQMRRMGKPRRQMHSPGQQISTGIALLLVPCVPTPARSQNGSTSGEFWPGVDAHIQFADNWRFLGLAALKKGEDFSYQQLKTGLGLGY